MNMSCYWDSASQGVNRIKVPPIVFPVMLDPSSWWSPWLVPGSEVGPEHSRLSMYVGANYLCDCSIPI